MSRIIRMTNTSQQVVELKMTNGTGISLPPGASVEGVQKQDVQNIDQVRSKMRVTEDLSDVGADKPERGQING